jgi:hypothetical protein
MSSANRQSHNKARRNFNASTTGYDKVWFVSNVDALTCGICLGVLNNPYQCKNGHMCCKGCFMALFLQTRECRLCPGCRLDIDIDSLSVNLYAKNMIDTLTVTCNCREDKDAQQFECNWTGTLEERADRMCPVMFVDCANLGCNVSDYHLADLEKHKLVCLYRVKHCKYCDKHVPNRTESGLLHKNLCEQRPITCEYCNKLLPNKTASGLLHKNLCEHRPVTCECGMVMSARDRDRHIWDEECDMLPTRCLVHQMFGVCIPACTGRVTIRDLWTHLGPMEQFVRSVFDQHIQINHCSCTYDVVRREDAGADDENCV